MHSSRSALAAAAAAAAVASITKPTSTSTTLLLLHSRSCCWRRQQRLHSQLQQLQCRRAFTHPSTGRQAQHSSKTRPLPPKPAAENDSTNDFISIADAPAKIISTRRKTSKLGILWLAIIPLTAFCLGTWQVARLEWKSKLIAKFEDRLIRPPLPLPPHVDPDAIQEFDYRRVYATGTFRHDREMLIGPRMHDGVDGYLVVTPLERGEESATVLVSRGWISREKKYQRDRDGPAALPRGEVTVSGLLREPYKKNVFTPDNKPEEGKFYFPDVKQMARFAGAEPVWIEETMTPSLLESYDREARGIPIGRAAAVNLRNNHAQYIFTWYSLSAATTVMMWMVLKRKPSDLTRRVKTSKEW